MVLPAVALALAFGAAAASGGPREEAATLAARLPADVPRPLLRGALEDLQELAGDGSDPEWRRSLELLRDMAPAWQRGSPETDGRAMGRWVTAMAEDPVRPGWLRLRRAVAWELVDHVAMNPALKRYFEDLATAEDPEEAGAIVAAMGRIASWLRVMFFWFLLLLGLAGLRLLTWPLGGRVAAWARRVHRLLVRGPGGVVVGLITALFAFWLGTYGLLYLAVFGGLWWSAPRPEPSSGAEGARSPPPVPVTAAAPETETARGPRSWLHHDPRYRDVERLGSGGMATVFGAVEVESGRVVAIKTLASLDTMDSDLCARFLREAQALERIRHPGLPEIHAVHQEPVPHMVMEKVAGMSLEELAEKQGPADPARVRRWVRQAGEALAAAHAAGVIHRDVKPANLMVDASDRVRVVDFGLAFLEDHTRLTRTGQAVGTPAFMPREQIMGDAPTAANDVYSLSATAYYLLTGRYPFHPMLLIQGEGLRPPEIPEDVPVDLAAALQAGLQLEPADRPPTVEALLELLEPEAALR